MDPKDKNLTDRHLSLLRAYFLVLQRVDRFSWLIWIPTGWLGFIRVPVLTVTVHVFVSSHILRVLESLDRAYQRRLAIDEASPDGDDWKKLHEQAESMVAGLRPFLLAKWLFATLAFVLVLLVAQSLPHGDLIIKMAGAVATANPGKLAELTTEPFALEALGRLAVVMLMMFIALTPILIYHFRFKRLLFNRPGLLTAPELNVEFGTVWGERSISGESLYVLERDVSSALGDPALPEMPLDLLAVVIAFLYHAAGPGLAVGIFAWQVYAVNQSAGRQLLFVAAVCGMIGLSSALIWVGKIRQRSKELAEA
jgi:hypothetical protein